MSPLEILMSERTTEGELATWARVAGLGYLAIIATGIFAEFFVRSGLIVSGDAAATAANIAASEVLYRVGIGSEFIMLASDVLLALALYVVVRPVSRNLALLAAFFRLAHAAIVGLNLLNTWIPLLLLGDASYLAALDLGQRQALASLFLDAHAYGYVIGLTFFGVYCLILGSLVFRSNYIPRVLGVLLMVAGAAYLLDSFSRTLLVSYDQYETLFGTAVLLPALVGELSFALWLLVRGGTLPDAETARRIAG